MSEDKKKKGFTLKPDVFKPSTDSQGNVIYTVDEEASDRYIMLQSMSVGRVFYAPKANLYFPNESDGPINEEYFNEKFLPYLRWEFSQLEPLTRKEENEVTVREGDKNVTKKVKKDVQVLDGFGKPVMVDKFPPTTENIEKKRQELMQEAVKEGKAPNIKEIYQRTSPNALRDLPEVEAQLDKPKGYTEEIARIKRTSR